jgi:hypothetical protein
MGAVKNLIKVLISVLITAIIIGTVAYFVNPGLFLSAPAPAPAPALAPIQKCSGGWYCNGVSADGTPVEVPICGGGMTQWQCNLVNGQPTWQSLNKPCATGMPNSCPAPSPTPTPTIVPSPSAPLPSPISTTPPVTNSLKSNGLAVLKPGQMLTSNDKRWTLVFQTDGNLVGYTATGQVFFSANSNTPYVGNFVMQSDGNAVIYDSNSKPLWNSKSVNYNLNNSTAAPFTFVLQDDKNLVIYDANGVATWASIQ